MVWKPHVTVAAVIEQDGKFLLVEELAQGRKVLNQPAGHLEAHESLVQAVIRETREETAWNFIPDSISGIYQWTNSAKNKTFLRFAFCGAVDRHAPERELDTGILRTIWLSRQQVLARSARLRSPMVVKCIDDYLAGIRYPLATINYLPPDPDSQTETS